MSYRLKAVLTLPAKRDGDSENVLSRISTRHVKKETKKKEIIDKIKSHHIIVYHPCAVVNK